MSDLANTFHDAPLNAEIAGRLAGHGLHARRVDDAARAETDRWQDAVARGFLNGEPNDTQHEVFAQLGAYRRKLGVYDAAGAQPDLPVATFASWIGELTLPGAVVPACAISAVTVAPTHRRRGILRTLMSGELRTAAELGVPIAALTVSESTIYGRFGFSSAAQAAHWEIDTRHVRWAGPEPTGRFDFLTREQGRAAADALHQRVRAGSPGELKMPGGHWDRFFGTRADAEKADQLRVVQFRGDAGEVDGLALYRAVENEASFDQSTVEISLLIAATDEAYAALWHFFLSMDLISTIKASELAVDEPLWWMIGNHRAASIRLLDHHYLRVLDAPAVLQARSYDVADTIVLEVSDPLEITGGTFVLTTDSTGVGEVDVVDAAPVGLPAVQLGVAELSALVLGGVSAVTLARAGRLRADDVDRVARVFQTTRAPRLSYWY
ncbi:MAG: GNAT family N-acetyltransferase [Microbacterium sp.]|uniref:GNAT family N-acetyltransferase n=1 Tax=Microbacterium sp. TaxID=51671 RepID=UPI001AC19C49|nr:GNAT family N-acetyltransferase [Microbacterium sp.]MBN9175866.1 GNAT family N-acetyltransferase [Microbacterium sp.]